MEERSKGMTSWKRKRSLQEAAARARDAKQARDVSSSKAGETDLELETSSDIPGPSGTPLPARFSVVTPSERESEPESESHSKWGSDDSGSGDEFTDERAQETFDNFMVSLSSVQRMTLSVLLMHNFQQRHKMKVTDAAQEAGSITVFNERTVRKFRKEYFDNKGKFPETKQGKYKRRCLLNDKDLQLQASMFVRENAYKKGEANFTAQSLCKWVNDELLQSHDLTTGAASIHFCVHCYTMAQPAWFSSNQSQEGRLC